MVSCLCQSPSCGQPCSGWDIREAKPLDTQAEAQRRQLRSGCPTYWLGAGGRQASISLLLTGKWHRHEKGELETPGA